MNNQKKNQEKTSDARSNKQTSRKQQDNKPKKRRSVIKRLHQKQITIAQPVRKANTKVPGSGNGKKTRVEYAKVKV